MIKALVPLQSADQTRDGCDGVGVGCGSVLCNGGLSKLTDVAICIQMRSLHFVIPRPESNDAWSSVEKEPFANYQTQDQMDPGTFALGAF